MNSKKIIPIKHKNCTCMSCLQEFDKEKLHIIEIKELGYGSYFDGTNTKIILCSKCFEESDPTIWNLEIKFRYASEFPDYKDVENDFVVTEEYTTEDKIIEYVENLPIQSKELFFNSFESGWNTTYKMNPQDWIDYELGELSFNKCKKYGIITIEEKEAYSTRFQNCEWVVNKQYRDDIIISQCPFGAVGNVNQEPKEKSSVNCYQCPYYKTRTTDIKTIKAKDFIKYQENIKLKIERKNDEEII